MIEKTKVSSKTARRSDKPSEKTLLEGSLTDDSSDLKFGSPQETLAALENKIAAKNTRELME